MDQTDKQKQELRERTFKRIADKLKGELFQIDGTPSMTVKLPNEQYRRRPGLSGQEMFFNEVYVGKSGKMFLVFEPADAQEYKLIEFSLEDTENYVPLFGPALAEAFNLDVEDTAAAIERIQELILKEDAERAEQERLEALEHHKNNPLFGRF